MELNRYVLMKNGKILDLRKVGFTKYITVEEMVKNYGKVKSTSDNILDFVEMADLIEVDYLNGILDSRGNEIRVHKIYLVQLVTKDISDKTHIVIDMKEDGNIDVKKDYIVAIYKRQPNGDYKKYEVK